MAITSKVELCNLSISHLGNYGSINNIDTPSTDKELVFALWYDISRQAFLKMTMPNFCLKRRIVSKVIETPAFGYKNVFEYPSDCLKLLGIGNIADKENNYSVEGNRIYTDEDPVGGLPVRFIADITDVTLMSPEFKIGFSYFLAANVALPITQDFNIKNMIERILPEKMSSLSGLNAQENMPIRISRSKFQESRYVDFPTNSDKK